MKKRLISIAITLTMLLSIGSHVTAQESSDSTPETTPVQAVTIQPEYVNYRDGDVPAGTTMVDSITPPVSALVLCMLELGLDYNQQDDSFYWSGLYYMLSLYGQMDSRAVLTDDTLILPPEAVADYAAALFAGFNGLPALPEALAERITLVDGEYHLARGDAGQLNTVIASLDNLANGDLLVTGTLVSDGDGSDVCTFTIQLQPNNSMFGYAICDAVVK